MLGNFFGIDSMKLNLNKIHKTQVECPLSMPANWAYSGSVIYY